MFLWRAAKQGHDRAEAYLRKLERPWDPLYYVKKAVRKKPKTNYIGRRSDPAHHAQGRGADVTFENLRRRRGPHKSGGARQVKEASRTRSRWLKSRLS